MSHEITKTDGLVLSRKPAWHGLGIVVTDAMTPLEALSIAGLDWPVEQWPLIARSDAADTPSELPVDTHVLNIRGDTRSPLGVVGRGYQPVQNHALAEFAMSIGATGEAETESAGSIRGGRRVWFLLKGESVWVAGRDEVRPYLLVANAHDGTLSVTVQPTTVRVVCKNTLMASLAQGQTQRTSVRFRHEGEIQSKLDEARQAIGVLTEARDTFEKQTASLNAREMTREDLQRFWLDVYTATVDEVPKVPITPAETARVEQCRRVLATWSQNFDLDREQQRLSASAWTALNACTFWWDHQRVVRAPNETTRRESRIYSNLWGTAAAAKHRAMQMALAR